MDVLLVNSRLKEVTQHACLSLPLGLAYIGAVLQGAGYDVSAIDLNVTPVDDAQITRLIERASPSILAISTNTPTYLSGLTFARRAKEVNPGIKVVVGGPHASVLYREVAMEKEVDVVARSEGEYTMLELADCLIRNRGELADIKGVAYKDNGAIRVTGKRAPITDPDQLPFPARHLFPFGLYDIPNAVLASRGGCPFGCYFCAVNNIWEGKIRHRNPRKVIEEIFSVVNTFGIRQAGKVSFSDDVFTLDRKKALDICHLISQSMDSNPLPWRCTTRVDLVDAELIKEK
jgi:anaerobic magnesium-protoporphyrin IX monomethyl ester cyclase